MPLNPLSAFTFHRRNKRRSLSIFVTICLMVFGIHTMVSTLETLNDTVFANNQHLRKFSTVSPKVERSLDPAVVSQIKANPNVAKVILDNGFGIDIDLIGGTTSFELLGVSEADMMEIMTLCDARLKEGELLRPRTNEIVLSEEIANSRGLRIGDKIGSPVNERDWMPTEFVLVGILEGDIRLGFVSYEFLESHELYTPRRTSLIIVPREGKKAELDDFLEHTIASNRTRVWTYNRLVARMTRESRNIYLVVGIVDGIITAVITIAVGLLNYIYFTQRLEEFGVLQAIGHSRGMLIRRVFLETTVSVVIAWVVGGIFSLGAALWAREAIYEPRGLVLNLANYIPFLYTIPIPLAVIVFGTGTVAWTLSKLDPVSIVEKR